MPELNLDKLGKFTASADNAARYKLFLVSAGKGIDGAALERNPDLANDSVIAWTGAADAGGQAVIELKPLGDDIRKRLGVLKHDAQLESYVVAFGEDGKKKAAAGPAFTVKADIIHKGEVTAPPKKSDSEADPVAEQKWWGRLEETSIAELQPGDILIKKIYDEDAPVPKGQRIFTAPKGTKFADHLMLYAGDGMIIHASPEGVARTQVQKSCIVYRAQDPKQAAAAVATAKWFVGQKVVYSMFHCMEAPFGDISFGPEAKKRHEMVVRRELPSPSLMCSELVTYTYQSLDEVYILLDALRTPPIKLENWLNENPAKFRFAGKLLEGVDAPPSSPSQGLNAFAAEIKADVKAEAAKVVAAATTVEHKAEDVGHAALNKLKSLF